MRGYSFIAAPALALALVGVPSLSQSPVTPPLNLLATSGYFVTPSYIRAGVPITFSARALPADATGTLTFYVDSVPVQTSTIAPQTIGDYIAIGDSITYAEYIGDPSQRFQSIVGQALNLNVSAYASPGYTACDAMVYNIIPNNIGVISTTQPLYSFMIGANDVIQYGVGANEAIFNLCHQSVLTWLGVPRQNKVLIGDPGVQVLSGSWTTAPAFNNSQLNALTSTSGSGTVRFNLETSGGAAYLWYVYPVNTPGSFTVSIDGGPATDATSTLFPATTVDGIPGSYALLRLPVAAGVHTFDIASQSGSVGILGMGSAPAAGAAESTVLATDVPANEVPTLTAGLAEYTADIAANVSLLRGDGLDIRFAPTASYMHATPAEMMDSRHPNALGLSELAQALLAAITPANPASDTTSVAAASFTSSSLAVGSYQIAVSYSGDSKYSPATTSINGLVLYDPTSSTSLSGGSSVFPVQTPITFTAAVANATGLVNFVDTTSGGNVLLGSAWLNGAPSVSLTVPSLSAAQHTIVAQFQGDVINAPSSSTPMTVTVMGPYTTTTLSAPATRYYAAAPVVLTAAVAPAQATGSVTFLDGTTVLGQATLVSGVATLSTSALTPGIHALTASFNGNANENSSVSPPLAVEIDPNPTTLAITPLPATLAYGTPVALTANISPAAAAGTVGLSDSFVALGQATAIIQSITLPALSSGAASVITSTLAPGTHTFTAVYSGDTDDLPSISSAVNTHVTLAASSIALAPIPANVPYGNALSIAASVTPAGSTGTVTFSDSVSGTLAEAPLLNGAASSSISTLAPGPHSFTAAYPATTSEPPPSAPPSPPPSLR